MAISSRVSAIPESNECATSAAVVRLLEYCRSRDWAGYDPYDCLNSRWFQKAPFLNSRWPRLVMTQTLKRAPINLRPMLLIAPSQNPKGLGLFLQALLKLEPLGFATQNDINYLAERIADLRSPGTGFSCWGYSFPWQTRTQLVPRGAPNLVCTTFVANALLDFYESQGGNRWLEMAASAAHYISKELFWNERGIASFRYPMPDSTAPIHNANFLAAALLIRVQRMTGEKGLRENALAAARFSLSKQQADGSWFYGEAETQKWIDNFHTGFNLTALRSLSRDSGSAEFDAPAQAGFRFYRDHFLGENGRSKYFHDREFPVDVHCISQTILTLVDNAGADPGALAAADKVVRWALKNFVSPKGYFYHQKSRWLTNKIPYMRWGQAWMLFALSTYLEVLLKPVEEDLFCEGQRTVVA